jgi:Uma2 family endonuclease
MAAPQLKTMTADEFLLWCLDQDERYELVDGVPMPMRAMAGASTAHDRIASNIIVSIGTQLRGTGCWPTTPDTAVRTKINRVRRPDVTIECAPPDQKTYEARNPVAAFEVLSPTTEGTDKLIKLPEYMRHPTLRTIALISPFGMVVHLYQRDDAGEWQGERLRAPEDVFDIQGTSAKLSLAEIYGGVPLAPPA